MWVFGHLGIGSKIAAPLSRKLSYPWLLTGTLLPDLIDKPLYYGLSLATGRTGPDLGLISCTRTFGHSAILLFIFSFIALTRKSTRVAALTLGMASHLVLDGFQDYWIHVVLGISGESSLRLAALYPIYRPHFGILPYRSLFEHLQSASKPFVITTEILGALILAWDYWKKQWRPKRVLRSGLPWRKPRAGR